MLQLEVQKDHKNRMRTHMVDEFPLAQKFGLIAVYFIKNEVMVSTFALDRRHEPKSNQFVPIRIDRRYYRKRTKAMGNGMLGTSLFILFYVIHRLCTRTIHDMWLGTKGRWLTKKALRSCATYVQKVLRLHDWCGLSQKRHARIA
jgi:hypothetical protein